MTDLERWEAILQDPQLLLTASRDQRGPLVVGVLLAGEAETIRIWGELYRSRLVEWVFNPAPK
jgi:hypothetical protein